MDHPQNIRVISSEREYRVMSSEPHVISIERKYRVMSSVVETSPATGRSLRLESCCAIRSSSFSPPKNVAGISSEVQIMG